MVLPPRKSPQTQSSPGLVPPLKAVPRLPSLACPGSAAPSARGINPIHSERIRSQSAAHLRGTAINSERGRGHCKYDERGHRILEPLSLGLEATRRIENKSELDSQFGLNVPDFLQSSRKKENDPDTLNWPKPPPPTLMDADLQVLRNPGHEPARLQLCRQREHPPAVEESMDRLRHKALENAKAGVPEEFTRAVHRRASGLYLQAMGAKHDSERAALKQLAAEALAEEQLSEIAVLRGVAHHEARPQAQPPSETRRALARQASDTLPPIRALDLDKCSHPLQQENLEQRRTQSRRKPFQEVQQLLEDLGVQKTEEDELKWKQWMAWASETKRQEPDEDVIRVLEEALIN